MTTNQSEILVIHFTIDGRHGILGARHIAEALHIPYEPACPEDFRAWTHPSQSDIVHTLSRGASSRHYILRNELPPNMFFIDALLRHNIFPLQHWVQRRGVLLEALFRISEGYFFGPHHLIMVALMYFEEKIWEHLGYPAEPQHERRRICREIFTLDRWTSMMTYDTGDTPPPAPVVASTEPIPEVPPSAPQATPQTPLVIPPISEPSPSSEPRIAIPIIEYRGLCHTFQALATSQSILTQQMIALRAHRSRSSTIGPDTAIPRRFDRLVLYQL
ncbi:hypothetical protein AAG906_017268 [Vitis piasezkii]